MKDRNGPRRRGTIPRSPARKATAASWCWCGPILVGQRIAEAEPGIWGHKWCVDKLESVAPATKE